MAKDIVFDTLSYFKMLKQGGVGHAEVHLTSLSKALSQNIYTKIEIKRMLEEAYNRLEKTLEEFKHEGAKDRAEYNKRFLEIELRLEKTMNRYMITTVSILGTLIVVMSTISTFAHYIFH